MTALFPKLAQPGARPALTVGDRTLTYAELADGCSAHIRSLRAAGVGPGDRVGVWARPALDTAIAIAGNALFGAVSVPLNPKLGRRERDHILGDAAPRLVVGGETATRGAPAPAAAGGLAEDAALILYTSGTTGAPKGAVVTAANIAANLDALADAWQWSADDTVVHALPLFHVHGLVLGLFGCLRVGAHLHWMPRFEPERMAAALPGNVLFAVPTMYHRLADAAEREPAVRANLRAARLLVSGSAGLPAREHERLGCPVYERYGLTETLINCAVRADGPPRPGYVGPPLAGVELALVDDARRPFDARDDATIGEIAVRGPSVFAGYLGRADATAAVVDADGWFYTGDLATRSADGAVRIHGRRATDLIKTGGYKVGAGEIEACLLEAAGVAEVAVVGVDDADLGQRIEAFVVAREPHRPPSAESLIDHVAAELTPHKRPRAVHLVTELPRNAMGKVQKSRLTAPRSS